MDMTSGVASDFGKYWEQIVEHFENFVPKTFHMIYMNLTFYNVIIIMIKYLPLILYMEKYVRNVYKESRKRLKLRNAEIEDILLKLDIVNAKIPCEEAEVKVTEDLLKRSTEQLRVVRAQVRQIVARSDLGLGLKLPDEHMNVNAFSEEESKLFEELIKECKQEHIEEPEKVFDVVYDADSLHNTFSRNDRDYSIKIVKVTNVYKMSYLQHHLKQKRLQRARHATLKKKTKNTQKLFNDWHNALNAVTQRDHMDCVITSEVMPHNESYEILHTSEERELYQDYVNQCKHENYSEIMAPERELMCTDHTCQLFDNRYNCRAKLSVLPEETSSEVEIQMDLLQ